MQRQPRESKLPGTASFEFCDGDGGFNGQQDVGSGRPYRQRRWRVTNLLVEFEGSFGSRRYKTVVFRWLACQAAGPAVAMATSGWLGSARRASSGDDGD